MKFMPPQSWDEFEELCFQLFTKQWFDSYVERNGRKGQGQQGVDIYREFNGHYTGLQCKGKQTYSQTNITQKEISGEAALAKDFKPALKDYIILTTAQRDSKIQEFVRLESIKNSNAGSFTIHILFWEDIEGKLKYHIDLIKLFYPTFISQDTEKIERIDETTQKTDNKTDIIYDEVRKMALLFPNIKYSEVTDLKDDIDYAKQLLETHKPETALDNLMKLKESKWVILSEIAKFRILTHIGSAKFQMNLFEEAAEYFIQAYEFNKNDEKSLSNLALAYSIKNDDVKVLNTIELILRINPKNIDIYSLLILYEKSETEVVLNKIPTGIVDKPEILHSIGFRFFKEGKYIKAINYFQSALENDKENNPNIRANYASCKLEIIDSPDIVKSEINIKESLEEIIILFNSALERFQETEEIKYKYQWILNRGLAKKLNGDIIGAEDDIKLALKYNENDRIAKHDLSLLYFEQDKDKGIKYLKELVDSQKIPEDRLLLSDFYRLAKKYEDAEKYLKELIEQDIEDKLKSNAYRILETAYEEQGLDDKANEINLERVKLNPKDILARVDSAVRSRKRGIIELSNTKLIEAIGYLENETRFYERQVLSDALYNNKLYKEAIQVYEYFVNINEDSANSRKLLNCYYITKKWDKALELCNSLRIVNEKDIYLLNIETYIYEQLGNNPSACKLFEEYLKKYDESEVKLNLGLLYLKMNNGEALDILIASGIEYNKLSLEQRIQLTQLYSIRNKRDKFFNLLYETRRKFYNNSEAHSAYVWLILQRGDKDLDLLKIDTVADNTVVFLKRDNEEEYYILENNESADLSKKEINSKNPIYSKIIHQKINDDVILIDNEFTKEIWTIKEIKSKFIHALHESMTIFNKHFPDDKALQKVTIDKNDIKKSLKILIKDSDKSQKTVNEIISYYKGGKITLGMISNYFKKNIIEIWSSFIQDENIGLLNNWGNNYEISSANDVFNLSNKIVIDQTTLNTLFNLKLDSEILNKLNKFIISQSLMDEINQYKSEIDAFSDLVGFTIYKNGDKFFKEEKTKEIKIAQKEYLENLLCFANNYCQVIPLNPKMIADTVEYDNMRDLIGASSIDSILIAKQSNTLLYSDDLILRYFAKTEFKVDGIWTQYYIQKLMFENILSVEQYYNYVISLSDMNYKHTSINAEIILQSFRNSTWDVTSSSEKLLSILNGKNSDLIPAVMVAVNFTSMLWNQLISNVKRDSILIMLLKNLVKYRDIQHIISLFSSALRNKLYLLPKSYNEIINIINNWSRI
jgi:tetratricopeptide (TPR) repeat protein/predicted Zn-dependent protease